MVYCLLAPLRIHKCSRQTDDVPDDSWYCSKPSNVGKPKWSREHRSAAPQVFLRWRSTTSRVTGNILFRAPLSTNAHGGYRNVHQQKGPVSPSESLRDNVENTSMTLPVDWRQRNATWTFNTVCNCNMHECFPISVWWVMRQRVFLTTPVHAQEICPRASLHRHHGSWNSVTRRFALRWC